MKKVRIFDTTLRDGEQSPGCSMNLKEKLEMARELDRLGVDVIEAGFAISSPEDFRAVSAIADVVENAFVCSLARCVQKDIDSAAEAVKNAKKPMIHVFLATSDVHMKYKLNMTREEVIAKVAEMVAYAKSKCSEIEFSAEDASRTDREFLVQVLETAIENGATSLNIPDTVGYAQPMEMADLIKYLKENVKGIENCYISVHCHNDLGQAVANSLASAYAGATQIECTINGIGERAGNASLEEIVMAFKTRQDLYEVETNVVTKNLYRVSRLLSTITGVPVAPTKAIVGANAFAHEAGIHQHGVLKERTTYEIMRAEDVGVPKNTMVLGKHSGRHAFKDRLETLGYDLSDEAINDAFARFKVLADKKKAVTDRDIEALVHSQKQLVSSVYKLKDFTVVAKEGEPAKANVTLIKDNGEELSGEAVGGGPVDAGFMAIDSITNHEGSLMTYDVHAVSEGEDALGEVSVKVKFDDEVYTGRGLSTDVIEASIKAYLNSINKIVTIVSGKE